MNRTTKTTGLRDNTPSSNQLLLLHNDHPKPLLDRAREGSDDLAAPTDRINDELEALPDFLDDDGKRTCTRLEENAEDNRIRERRVKRPLPIHVVHSVRLAVLHGSAQGFAVLGGFGPRVRNSVASVHDTKCGEREVVFSWIFKDIVDRPQHDLLSQTRGHDDGVAEREDLRSKYEWVGGFGGRNDDVRGKCHPTRPPSTF